MSSASDFVIYKGRLEKYTGPGGDVVVPAGVTKIGDKAFRACEEVTSVILPDSLTSIDEFAFGRCTALTTITIPASVMHIDATAFFELENLTICGVPGSCAETFAKKKGYTFMEK